MSTFLLVLLVLLAPLFPAAQPAPAPSPNPAARPIQTEPTDWLYRLARVLGRSAGDLELADVAAETLLSGETLTTVKAIDRSNGSVVGATFSGDQAVDRDAARARAAAQWRTAHGALTPPMVAALDEAAAGATFTVAVWLSATVEPLRKPDHQPPAADSPGSTAAPATSTQPRAGAGLDDDPAALAKPPATPLTADEARAAGLPLIAAPPPAPPAAVEAPKDVASPAAGGGPDENAAADAPAQAEAYQQANREALRRQIAPVRGRFLDYAAAQGLEILYASEIAPVVHLANVTADQLLALARNPDVDAIYDASIPGGPTLDVARPTQNMLPVADWGGYTGDNVAVAVVEGERAADNNPYLTIVETRDTGRTRRWHPTMVSGIIASSHSTQRGLARDADVYSANGDDYATIAAIEAAMDWGSSRAWILNNSFWAANCGDTSPLESIDRHMDYLVRYLFDLAVVASGNFRLAGCGASGSNYVTSPSKGYNSLTVGNFDDGNSVGWTGDAMNADSQYNVDGRFKPELAASGTSITSLSEASPWTSTGTGTSFASPMVAALAADMTEADTGLTSYPEGASALLMATSLHNIEGDQRLSRADGVGSINGSAGLVSVERDHWGSQYVDNTTVFPMDFYQYAYKGERVRYVIRWLSNPNAAYTTDPLPADIDLAAYRADGAYIQGSASASNSFEIVDFVAPASETYRFTVSLYGSWSGSGTWLGRGWWRGVYRIVPDAGYLDPQATPMGTHLNVTPTDWSPTNYWRVMGIRSLSSDHDLYRYNKSFFEDPSNLTLDDYSFFGSAVDFITVDGNHWPSSTPENYVVRRFSGSGGYNASWSNLGLVVNSNGYYGPYSAGSSEVAKVFDLWMNRYQFKRLEIVPTVSNLNDLAAELFKSSAGNAATWSQSRGHGVAQADSSSAPAQTESLAYYHDDNFSDYLGLIVYGNLQAQADYYVRVVCTLNHDVHGDGKVDISDVQYVSGYWQDPAAPNRADRDGDGDVDVFDISLVAGEWNTQC